MGTQVVLILLKSLLVLFFPLLIAPTKKACQGVRKMCYLFSCIFVVVALLLLVQLHSDVASLLPTGSVSTITSIGYVALLASVVFFVQIRKMADVA